MVILKSWKHCCKLVLMWQVRNTLTATTTICTLIRLRRTTSTWTHRWNIRANTSTRTAIGHMDGFHGAPLHFAAGMLPSPLLSSVSLSYLSAFATPASFLFLLLLSLSCLFPLAFLFSCLSSLSPCHLHIPSQRATMQEWLMYYWKMEQKFLKQTALSTSTHHVCYYPFSLLLSRFSHSIYFLPRLSSLYSLLFGVVLLDVCLVHTAAAGGHVDALKALLSKVRFSFTTYTYVHTYIHTYGHIYMVIWWLLFTWYT